MLLLPGQSEAGLGCDHLVPQRNDFGVGFIDGESLVVCAGASPVGASATGMKVETVVAPEAKSLESLCHGDTCFLEDGPCGFLRGFPYRFERIRAALIFGDDRAGGQAVISVALLFIALLVIAFLGPPLVAVLMLLLVLAYVGNYAIRSKS